ncbi:MAG: hypothetical protein OES38_03110 [Gammaproteobacteria bacterium]|nr:hypothetical protein [Gammaproteobacteria bacterium]
MKTTIQPVGKLVYLLFPLLALTGLNAQADSHVPPPPGTLEAFFCIYNDGKDRDDLDAATSFYLKQAEKAGFAAPTSYLWTLNKGTGPADIVWVNAHESLSAFGASSDAFAASEDMAAAGERFSTVADCQPNLATVSTVFAREDADDGGATALATYACNFRPGASPAAMLGVHTSIAEWNKSLGDDALNGVYQIVPMTGNAQTPDVAIVAVAENTAAWAAHVESLGASPAGQATSGIFGAVLDCTTSLWWSEQIVGGEG